MSFKLSKGVGNGDVPMETYVASGAIAANMPVALLAFSFYHGCTNISSMKGE